MKGDAAQKDKVLVAFALLLEFKAGSPFCCGPSAISIMITRVHALPQMILVCPSTDDSSEYVS
jgi:hypothetical protein